MDNVTETTSIETDIILTAEEFDSLLIHDHEIMRENLDNLLVAQANLNAELIASKARVSLLESSLVFAERRVMEARAGLERVSKCITLEEAFADVQDEPKVYAIRRIQDAVEQEQELIEGRVSPSVELHALVALAELGATG